MRLINALIYWCLFCILWSSSIWNHRKTVIMLRCLYFYLILLFFVEISEIKKEIEGYSKYWIF